MKKKLLRVLAVILTVILLLTCVTSSVYGWWTYTPVSKELEPMSHHPDVVCSLCAGTSIGQYYRDEYDDLPAPYPMYHSLEEYMDTGIFGYVNPINYGPGFVEMALHYEYDNFSYYHNDYVTNDDEDSDGFPDDFKDIVDAIENGWPVALTATRGSGFKDVPALPGSDGDGSWPCEKRHWIAIKGYSYYEAYFFGYRVTWGYRILCTDSSSDANDLLLSWDELVAEVGSDYLEFVIIKDEDDTPDGPAVEDFEWGSDGASLEAWQSYGGEVDWTVSTSGNAIIEIETDPDYVHSGTRSARFYRGGISSCYAYYDLLQPYYIEFYLKKGDTANAGFRNGDGDKRIYVDITDAEELRYFDTTYQSVCSVSANEWHFIEFRNIDWEAGTYNIYVDGYCPPAGSGAEMRSGSGSAGKAWFEIFSGTGSFWIDDIDDSLRE